jgi:hypothetical protein
MYWRVPRKEYIDEAEMCPHYGKNCCVELKVYLKRKVFVINTTSLNDVIWKLYYYLDIERRIEINSII